MKRARLFRTGRSWAVRLPKAWVGEATEVDMERQGDRIVLTPRSGDPWQVAEECAAYGQAAPRRLPQSETGIRVRFER